MADSSTNPYLALLQQQDTGPTWAQILQSIGNLGLGLAGGFSQAASSGQPTMAGVGPGLLMGNQMNAQAAQGVEQDRLKRVEIGLRAQEYEDKRTEMLRKQKALEDFGKVGFNVTPQPGPVMGPSGAPTPTSTTGTPQPGSYDTRVAGAEGGARNGGMVFNELGSGAFGPYQFMPATYAGIRAKNPGLNLPEDMTQATREQWDQAHNALRGENAQGLQAAGFQPTPENLYLAHRFGVGGATSVLRADPDKLLSEVLPIDWQRQNPDMRGQTAGGFRRLATERMGGSSVPYVVPPNAKPTPYSMMPDDVQFDLGSAGATLPRPSTAQPSVTAPVMPQPQWQTPGDVMPVNPAAWFPQQQPPAIPAAPGGPPQGPTVTPSGTVVDPNAPPPPFMQTGSSPAPGQPPAAPGAPTPGGPNVVQPQYVPQPGQPTMTAGAAPAPASATPPPLRPVVPMPPPDPEVVARARAGMAAGVLTAEQGLAMVRQNVMDKHKQADEAAAAQYAPQLEAWKVQRAIEAEQRRQQIQIEAENRREAAKRDSWRPMTKEEVQQQMPGVPPNVQFQINTRTGETKPVDGGRHGDISSFYAAPEVQAKVNALSPVDHAAFNAATSMGDFKAANAFLTKATTGLTEDQQQLHGDELLKTLPYGDRSVVGGLVDGTLTLADLSKRAANGADINRYVTLAKQVDPEWSPGAGGARRAFETKYMSGAGQGNATLLAANTSIAHMRSFHDLVSNLNNTNSPAFNEAMNRAKVQFGDANVPTAQSARILLGNEIAKAVKGGGPLGEKEEQAAQTMVNPNATPAQSQAALNMLTDFMMGRVHSIEDMARGHGISDKTIQNYISPRSREALEYMQKNPLGSKPAMVPKPENRPSLDSILSGGR